MVATVRKRKAGMAILKTKSVMPRPAVASRMRSFANRKPSAISPKTGRTVVRMAFIEERIANRE
jgi:hypothetical protein